MGRYLVDALLAGTNDDLLLLVRNPAALPEALRDNPRVRIRLHDLVTGAAPLEGLPPIRAAILAATAWGGAETCQAILENTLALADRIVAQGCRQVQYFSTASILDREGTLLDVARAHGTDYIKAKHALTSAMERRSGGAQIIGLFPTVVIGGHIDGSIPLSHFARLLHQARRWARLIRLLDAEARLHVVHAADIATVCVLLLKAPPAGRETPARLVLGNPAITADDLVRAYAGHLGLRRWRLMRLRPSMADAIVRLFRIHLSPWDRYYLQHADQSYSEAVSPATFGKPLHMPDIASGLVQIGLPRRGAP